MPLWRGVGSELLLESLYLVVACKYEIPCFLSINAFIMVVYIELSVCCTRTCSLDSVFTRYLFGAMSLSNSMSGFVLATPNMNIGGGLGSVCWEGASS